MIIDIKTEHPKYLPVYACEDDAGADVRARLESPVILQPFQRVVIPTGCSVEIPRGWELQVRPRSGLAAKHGITVLNTPGTIDSGFRGEIGVILINLGDQPFTIYDGERIAQIVLAFAPKARWHVVDQLNETERGTGGFGHTGK